MSGMTDPIAYLAEPVLLEKLKFAAQTRLSPSVAASANLETTTDVLTQQLVARVSVEVQAQRIAEGTVTESREVVVETPATTWQMFKHRHADSWWLRWLVRRRPVRLTQHRRDVTLTATWIGYATFPDSTVVLPPANGLGSPVYRLHRDTYWAER